MEEPERDTGPRNLGRLRSILRRDRSSTFRGRGPALEPPAGLFGLATARAVSERRRSGFVLVDSKAPLHVTPEVIRSRAARSLFEGETLQGRPMMTILRGEIIAEDGVLIATKPGGRFLARTPAHATSEQNMRGIRHKIGVVLPAKDSVLEPSLAPPALGCGLYVTRILVRGDLNAQAIETMETHAARALDELTATGVDLIVYADMVTDSIMPDGWNERRTAAIEQATGLPFISAWTAMEKGLAALGARRLAIGSPYRPQSIRAPSPIPEIRRRGCRRHYA